MTGAIAMAGCAAVHSETVNSAELMVDAFAEVCVPGMPEPLAFVRAKAKESEWPLEGVTKGDGDIYYSWEATWHGMPMIVRVVDAPGYEPPYWRSCIVEAGPMDPDAIGAALGRRLGAEPVHGEPGFKVTNWIIKRSASTVHVSLTSFEEPEPRGSYLSAEN